MPLSMTARLFLCLILICQCKLIAQESQIGFEVPATITFSATFTDRFKNSIPSWLSTIDNPIRSNRDFFAPGTRLLLAPTLKLGRHWYFHATWQAHTTPFFPYEAYHVNGEGARGRLLQGFAAFTTGGERQSWTFKVGKLPTAFGHFTSRYNDRDNPLIDSPLAYGSYLLLRPDSIPHTIYDFEHQQEGHPNISAYHGNHSEGYAYGILPVNPYGVFAVETDLTWRRLDARFQLANSSPSNPQKIGSSSQAAQFAGGLGINLFSGLRAGLSLFRGPWLQSSTQSQLVGGLRWNQFNASGMGVDMQWAYSRLAVSGEWQRFRYSYPNFQQVPSVQYGYVEGKWTLHPRWFTATRLGFHRHGMVGDHFDKGAKNYLPNRAAYEFSLGFRPRKGHLLKSGYTLLPSTRRYGPRDDVFALQWVIDPPTLSWTR